MQPSLQGEAMNDQIETVRRPAEESANLPVVHSQSAGPAGGAQAQRTRTDAGYAAQRLGAAGQRRGLKGGQPVLDAARRVYLETQWSGRGNRRDGPGAVARLRI